MSELKEVSDEEQEGSAKKKVKLSEKLKSIPLSSGKQIRLRLNISSHSRPEDN